MIHTANLRAELTARTASGAVLPDADTARWTVSGTEPLAVVQPGSVEEVAALLAFCSDEGIPVEPAGAGTWLSAASPPAAPPVVISTARLSRIVEYEPADLVAGVEAGMTMEGLRAALAANRQMLPLDPPARVGSTIGATVGLGAAGPLRAAHRTPRDLLLGIQLVSGDGRVLRFGGRVVKNVAGYDVVRLVAGSRGTLGIITSAWLLLRAAPAADRTFISPAATPAEAASLALAIRDRIGGDAVEVVSTAGARLENEAGGAAWAVLTRLRGSEAAVLEGADRLAALTRSRETEADLWTRLGQDEAGAPLLLRLADRPVQLARTLDRAARLGAPGEWRLAAHGADGIVRMWRRDDAGDAGLAGRISGAAAELASAGGSLLCPVMPAPLRQLLTLPAADTRVLGLMAALRRTFDPAGILSPGRHAF